MSAEPFFKQAGGKRQLLDQLQPFWPASYNVYHEPFLGGGAVFFHLRPGRAVLSDANERLIRTYRGVRDAVDDVIAALERIEDDFYPLPLKKDEPVRFDYYIEHLREVFGAARATTPETLESDAEVAVWWLTLNRLGYNGMYRVNRQNGYNVPFGKFTSTPRVLHADALRAASAALRGVELSHAPWRPSQVAFPFVGPQRGDLVYFDPPYAPLSPTSDFVGYTAEGFRVSDQIALAHHAAALAAKGVHVRATNSHAPWLRVVWEDAGFRAFALQAKRSVNSRVEKRGAVVEHLFVPSGAWPSVTDRAPLLPLLRGEAYVAAHAEKERLVTLESKAKASKSQSRTARNAAP